MQSLSAQFLTFCRNKPADEEFDYTHSGGCAFYQFAVAHGIPEPDRLSDNIPEPIRSAIMDVVCKSRDSRIGICTFGALASRLEA